MLRTWIKMLTGSSAAGGRSQRSDEGLPENQPGSFTLTEIDSKETADGTLKTWLATSRAAGNDRFKFRLELLLKTPKGDSPFAFSKGAVARDGQADGRSFLNEVARAIESEATPPATSERVERLEFSTAILGTGLSRSRGDHTVAGSFTPSPPGNWTAFKLFLGDGEGEVFLNINLVAGVGEFSTKDPDYGEIVVEELAKVFLP